MDDRLGFVIGVSGRGRPVEGVIERCFAINHRELVVELVASGEAWCADAFVVAVVLKDSLRDAQVSHGSISQNPSQKGTGSCVETP